MVRNFDLPLTEIARPLLEEFWQHLVPYREDRAQDGWDILRG
jgi:hypothetical protein